MLWTVLIGQKRCGCLGISTWTSCSYGSLTDPIDYYLDMKCNRSNEWEGQFYTIPSAIC